MKKTIKNIRFDMQSYKNNDLSFEEAIKLSYDTGTINLKWAEFGLDIKRIRRIVNIHSTKLVLRRKNKFQTSVSNHQIRKYLG